MPTIIDRSNISQAYKRIEHHIRRTPVMDCAPGTFGLRNAVNLKLESLQHSGSFKARGAFNNLLLDHQRDKPVTAASGGNHGAAVAFVAQALGRSATIFVPETASPAKINRIRRYGANVHIEGARYADAADLCRDFQSKTGAVNIHAYDSAPTIAGQGTVGLEWQEQAKGLDTLLIAIGGGGLISGIASWFDTDVNVIGAEPRGSAALHAALAAKKPVNVDIWSIAADSLGARSAGDLTYRIISDKISDIVLVEDDAILAAQAKLWRETQIAAEPGGAAALAALISGAYRPERNEKIGILICGGNVDLKQLAATVDA